MPSWEHVIEVFSSQFMVRLECYEPLSNFSGKNIESYNVQLVAALVKVSDSYLCLHGGRGKCEETEKTFLLFPCTECVEHTMRVQ